VGKGAAKNSAFATRKSQRHAHASPSPRALLRQS
jgi:hypothetical protein